MSKPVHNGHRQRVMQKASEYVRQFYDHELLEALLFFALPRIDTNPLAHRLLERFGSLQNVLSADEQALCGVEGVGKQTAAYLMLQGELHRRIIETKPVKSYVRNSGEARRFVRSYFEGQCSELLVFVYMDQNSKVLSATVRTDSVTEAVSTELLDMLRQAAALHAKSLFIAHNHPSGNRMPSKEDLESTDKLLEFCRVCDIVLFDHLIYTESGTFSFRDAGLINPAKTYHL